MTLCVALLAALQAGLVSPSVQDTPEATRAVSAFYTVVLELHPSGLPDSSQMMRLAPLMSRRLDSLFRSARAYQDSFARAHPDDKPPFIEGDLFSSLFEGPAHFSVKPAHLTGGRYLALVHFDAPSGKPDSAFRWVDAAIVKREKGRYVLDDVVRRGTWPFASTGLLSAELQSRP